MRFDEFLKEREYLLGVSKKTLTYYRCAFNFWNKHATDGTRPDLDCRHEGRGHLQQVCRAVESRGPGEGVIEQLCPLRRT